MKTTVSQVIFCVLLLVAVSTTHPQPENQEAVARSGGNHNLILCRPPVSPDTHSLAYSYLLTREAQFLKVRTETLLWPSGELNENKITCIRVMDQITNGLGGYVDVTRGGLGQLDVELLFKSQWSRRMSFKIEIYTAD